MFEIFGMLLIFTGLIVAIAAQIWLLVVVFRQSVVWGLAVLIVPIVGWAFVIKHWDVSKKPFLVNLGGYLLLFFGGAVLGGFGGIAGVP